MVHRIPPPDTAETEGTVLRRRVSPISLTAAVSRDLSSLVVATGNKNGLFSVWTTRLRGAVAADEDNMVAPGDAPSPQFHSTSTLTSPSAEQRSPNEADGEPQPHDTDP